MVYVMYVCLYMVYVMYVYIWYDVILLLILHSVSSKTCIHIPIQFQSC